MRKKVWMNFFFTFSFPINFRVLGITLFGLLAVIITLFLAGLAIFAVYAGCDPITLAFIERKDQILPFYVMENLGFMIGIPGVFIACLFSGTMRYEGAVITTREQSLTRGSSH